MRRHLVKISYKQQSETVVSRIYKLLCERAETVALRRNRWREPRCNSYCKFRISTRYSESSLPSKLVEITYSITTRRVRYVRARRYVRGRSLGTASAGVCVFSRECLRGVPERKSKRKEITFGTDSLHYCPREIYSFSLVFSARAMRHSRYSTYLDVGKCNNR